LERVLLFLLDRVLESPTHKSGVGDELIAKKYNWKRATYLSFVLKSGAFIFRGACKSVSVKLNERISAISTSGYHQHQL
jgi:hypothetical protein